MRCEQHRFLRRRSSLLLLKCSIERNGSAWSKSPKIIGRSHRETHETKIPRGIIFTVTSLVISCTAEPMVYVYPGGVRISYAYRFESLVSGFVPKRKRLEWARDVLKLSSAKWYVVKNKFFSTVFGITGTRWSNRFYETHKMWNFNTKRCARNTSVIRLNFFFYII